MFERFFTADGSRSEGSTGLGLPIARCLAEEMGGKLTAKKETRGQKEWILFSLKMDKILR